VTEKRHPYLWGDPGQALDDEAVAGLRALLAEQFPGADLRDNPLPDWRQAALPAPRLPVPTALQPLVHDDAATRLLHAAGRSTTDLLALRAGRIVAPDLVATPGTDAEVAAVLDWCADSGAACIPFGGGTSVVGGVNPSAGERPVVTLQLRRLGRVLEVDTVSRAAHVQAGATGPWLEDQLRDTGLTLRFYPQSFEFSTLGGWIATRAGGHYATRLTHIDDIVECVTAITPTGTWTSARVPASGAGPSPDRLLLGSEGTLGVITDAWVRLQARPEHRAAASVDFATFAAAAHAVRLLAQSGLEPANCRVLDPVEALVNQAGDGSGAVLLLTFESSWRPVERDLDDGIALCRDAGGVPRDAAARSEAAERWRGAFFAAPYLRDALLGMGAVADTFETAVTWDRFDALHRDVVTAATAAVRQACGDGIVTCRITHAYADGAAPYFTVIAPGRPGEQAAQWAEIKAAASEAILAAGGTITHHHAVGADHRPWYDRQRPEPFARAFAAAKRELDPQGMLNPGVLLD
jgi:alkyldihydroxyacetonephosphate synthase